MIRLYSWKEELFFIHHCKICAMQYFKRTKYVYSNWYFFCGFGPAGMNLHGWKRILTPEQFAEGSTD